MTAFRRYLNAIAPNPEDTAARMVRLCYAGVSDFSVARVATADIPMPETAAAASRGLRTMLTLWSIEELAPLRAVDEANGRALTRSIAGMRERLANQGEAAVKDAHVLVQGLCERVVVPCLA